MLHCKCQLFVAHKEELKMKTMKKIVLGILCISLLFPCTHLSAHSGRTDGSGGHHDNKNASGLGSYHYHCGGHPAHLHENGICPYSSVAAKPVAKKQSRFYKTSTVKKVQNKLNRLGCKCGKADGSYGSKTKSAIRKFQKKKGMAINGKINKTLLKKLNIDY